MKHLSICLTFFFFVMAFQTNGQYYPREDSVSLEKHLFSLNFLTPGFSYERALNQTKSLSFSSSTGIAVLVQDGTHGSQTSYVLVPVFAVEYRDYYNLEKRKRQLKKTQYNSGNYLSFRVAYQASPIAGQNVDVFETETGMWLGPIWGIQRNGTITFNLKLGIGYFTGEITKGISPIADLSLGLNLSKLLNKKP